MRILLENISKKFGKVWAVDKLTMEIESGNFLVLLGPSGCGKTTTLRIVAGLETQDSGNIYFGDRLINDLEPKDRNLAMVFQNYALYPHMTVYNNIAFPLKVRHLPKEQIQKRVYEIASMIKIRSLLDRKPREISGGEAQRVALGRTIIGDSEIVLMDEPLSNLDAKLRIQMRAELVLLHRKLQKTTIYVTHDQVEAMTIGEKIAVMDRGVLQQVGTPEEIYNHPRNRFVAEFIGSPPINMLEARIVESQGLLRAEIDNYFIEVPPGLQIALRRTKGSTIFLGVRPENITFYGEKKPNSLSAEVELTESIGSDLYVYFVNGDRTIIARTHPFNHVTIGERAWLVFGEKNIHFFDKESGNSLLP